MARVCLSCGHENADGDDFCGSCGAFLRWNPTQTTAAVPDPAEAPPAPQAEPVFAIEQPVTAEPPAAEDGSPCPACGETIPHDRHFCPACGTYVTRSMAAITPMPTPDPPVVVPEPEAEPEPVVETQAAPAEPELPSAAELEGTPCPACGTNVPSDRHFCPNCGAYATRTFAAVPGPAAEAPAPPEPVAEAEPVHVPLTEPEPAPIAAETDGAPCPVCGTHVPAGDFFCPNCGAYATRSFAAIPEPPAAPAVEPEPEPVAETPEPAAAEPETPTTPEPVADTPVAQPATTSWWDRRKPEATPEPPAVMEPEPQPEPEPEPDAEAVEPETPTAPVADTPVPQPAASSWWNRSTPEATPEPPTISAPEPESEAEPIAPAADATVAPLSAVEPEPAAWAPAPAPEPVAAEPEPEPEPEPTPVAAEPKPAPVEWATTPAPEPAPEPEPVAAAGPDHEHVEGIPCPVCGANVPLDRYFCPTCGAYASRVVAAVVPPAAEPEPAVSEHAPANEPTPEPAPPVVAEAAPAPPVEPVPAPEPVAAERPVAPPPPAEPPRPPIQTGPPEGIQILTGELRPAIATGQLHGRLALMVRSSAEDTILVDVRASDARGVCSFEIEQPSFPASPGRRAGTAMKVHAPARMFGRTIDHELEIVATPRVPGAREERFEAVFRQRPKVPLWGAAVLILPVLAALFLITRNGGGGGASTPKANVLPRVKVPDLRGTASVATAERSLLRLGLRLGAVRHRRQTGPKPGSVIDESPPPGSSVAPGTAVLVTLAVGKASRVVPTVVGLTVDKAVARLRAVGLQLGQVETHGSAGTAIASQQPPAGTRVPSGSAVGISLTRPLGTTTTQTTTVTTTVGTSTAPTTTPTVPVIVPVAVPPLTGLRVGDAINTLGSAGLKPREERRISADVPAGSLIGQLPAAGKKLRPGSVVTLLVSAGMPDIAFDKDGHVFIAGGRTGTPVHTTARGGKLDEQPSWNATGTLIAFRRGDDDTGQIWVVRAGKPKTAHALTATGSDDRRPAFSPDGKVIAFVRAANRSAHHDLCFLRLAQPKKASCVTNAKLDVSRPTWSPDGKLVAVVAGPAVRGPTAEPVELELLRSSRPSSPNASTWKSLGLATAKLHGRRATDAVWSAAFRPDGKRLAISANWGSDFFHLFLVPISGTHLGKALSLPRIQGCELSWRPDGLELALVQRDATCAQFGTIVRVEVAHPDRRSVLTKLGAENPAWDPAPSGD